MAKNIVNNLLDLFKDVTEAMPDTLGIVIIFFLYWYFA
jgi:hypothetical protein